MRTRMLIAGGTVAALALGVILPALSAGASGTPASPSVGTAANPQRIDIVTTATAINNFGDIGPTGLSPGDLYVFSDEVSFANDPGHKVGHSDGRCTLVDPKPEKPQFGCTIITALPEGTITTEGTLINVPGSKNEGSITGGTGDYRRARGEAVLDLGPPTGPHQATFWLILTP
jgi:hypothetical protein